LRGYDGFGSVTPASITASNLVLATPVDSQNIAIGSASGALVIPTSFINGFGTVAVPKVLIGGTNGTGDVHVGGSVNITRSGIVIGNTGAGADVVLSTGAELLVPNDLTLRAGGTITLQSGALIEVPSSFLRFEGSGCSFANPGGVTAPGVIFTGTFTTDTVGVVTGTGAAAIVPAAAVNGLTAAKVPLVSIGGQGNVTVGGSVAITRSGVTIGTINPAGSTLVQAGTNLTFTAGGTLLSDGILTLQAGSTVNGGAGTLVLAGYDIALAGGAGSITGGGDPATSRLEIVPRGFGRAMFIGDAGAGTVIDATELQTIGGGFDNSVMVGSGTATTIGGELGTLAVGNGPWFLGSSSSNTVLASGLRIDGTTGNGALFFYGSTVTQEFDAKATAGAGGIGLRGNSFDLQGAAGDLATTGDIFVRPVANSGAIDIGAASGSPAPTLVTQA
ncbi:MAG: hypothetical protein ACK5PI_03170, partial [Acetobacteraceae bacterium]